MVTIAKAGFFKPCLIIDLYMVSSLPLYHALFATKEPKGFKSAIKDPKWFATMCDEMHALK